MKHKVTLLPQNEVVEVAEDVSLLQALRDLGVYVKSSCGGVASCSDCIIKVCEGADHLNTPSFEELALLGNVFHITKERLSCQTKISGDVTIDISAHDKSKDQEKLRAKTSKAPASKSAQQKEGIKVRKKQEVQEIKQSRLESRLERDNQKYEQDESWHKYWEKEQDKNAPKKKGGSRRPRPFKISKD